MTTFGSLSEPKWTMPGWRIEQRYRGGVLVGNWSEDRLKFLKGTEMSSTSTCRETYRPYSPRQWLPDPYVRRNGTLRNQGLEQQFFFGHHGNSYSRNFISTYDQQFCRGQGQATERRSWDRHRLAWRPEASDHPLQGESTRFGLKEEKEEKWKRLKELESHGDFASTHRISYQPHPQTSSQPHPLASTPRHLSSHLHPHNAYKDLHFRGQPLIVRPEVMDQKLLLSTRTKKSKLSATV